MSNILNLTIIEAMNARLAEYGLTSVMAEENGWTLCDSTEIQRTLGYLPDCNGYEVMGLKIPFTSPVTSVALEGEDGKPYHGIFLASPALRRRSGDGWEYHTDWLQKSMRFGGHVWISASAYSQLQAAPTAPVYLVDGAVNAESLSRNELPAFGVDLFQMLSPENEIHPVFQQFFEQNPREVVILLSERQCSPDIGQRLLDIANVLLNLQCCLSVVKMPDARQPGELLTANGMPFMLELFKTATTIRPKPMVPVSPSRLAPVAKSLGNAARYYQKVYRMTPLANQDSGIPVLFNEADHSFVQLHQDACPALFEEIANPMTFSKENVPIPAVFAPRDCRLLIEHQNFVTALNPLTICSPVPVLAKINGELRLVTGYDRDSGIHAAGEVQIPSSLEEAVELLNWIDSFTAFVSEGDRSRAMAHILAPALSLGGILNCHTPILFVEANDSQTGKGKKNKRTAAVYNAVPHTVNQTGSRGVGSLMEGFDAILISGTPIISIDNLDPGHYGKPFHSQKLCSFLTEDLYNARAAYMKNTPINPKRHVIMITTNGASLSRDIFNRSCSVRLTKQEGRTFPTFPEGTQEEHILHNYPKFLGAVFRVLLEWQAKGFPQGDLRVSTGFAQWWDVMDGIISQIMGMTSIYDGYTELGARTIDPTLSWIRDMMRMVERTENLGRIFTTPELLQLLQENDMWKRTSNSTAFQAAQLHFGKDLQKGFRLTGVEDRLEIDSWVLLRGRHMQTYDEGRHGHKEIATYTITRKPPVTVTSRA